MENFSILRKIVYTCAAIFVLQLALFVFMLWPGTTFVWVGLAVMAVICLYLVRIALLAISEAEKRDKNQK